MPFRLKERSRELEHLDHLPIDYPSMAAIHRNLETINAWLGGVHATLYHLRRYSKKWKPGEAIRMLDWGTGGADVPRAIVRWARRKGFHVEITGVDPSAQSLTYAREASREYPEIKFVQASVEDFQSHEPFDYAISSLLLHHLSDEQIVSLLKRSNALCRRGILFVDLVRSARAWAWIWALSRLFRAHPIVQHDGPLSVLRSFSRQNLLTYATRAGLSYLHVSIHFGYRYVLAGEK
jgi:SAM-dependent methyltransferase